MRITVRLFAGLRERAGWSRRELEGVTRVADVWAALGLGDEPPGLAYAVNREYADRDRELADGDEVALIPPVSGGAFLLSAEPLDLRAVVREVQRNEAGAIATFVAESDFMPSLLVRIGRSSSGCAPAAPARGRRRPVSRRRRRDRVR